MKSGDIHVPNECLVIASCSLGNERLPEVVLAWPTCDKSNFGRSYHLFKEMGEEFYRLIGKQLINYKPPCLNSFLFQRNNACVWDIINVM